MAGLIPNDNPCRNKNAFGAPDSRSERLQSWGTSTHSVSILAPRYCRRHSSPLCHSCHTLQQGESLLSAPQRQRIAMPSDVHKAHSRRTVLQTMQNKCEGVGGRAPSSRHLRGLRQEDCSESEASLGPRVSLSHRQGKDENGGRGLLRRVSMSLCLCSMNPNWSS